MKKKSIFSLIFLRFFIEKSLKNQFFLKENHESDENFENFSWILYKIYTKFLNFFFEKKVDFFLGPPFGPPLSLKKNIENFFIPALRDEENFFRPRPWMKIP